MVAKPLARGFCLNWMRTTNWICAACDAPDFAPAPDFDCAFGCCSSRIEETDHGPRARGCDFAPAPHFDFGCSWRENGETLSP